MENPIDIQYIAGTKTPDDWRAFRNLLAISDDSDLWRKAFVDYFLARLDLRYLGPIKVLQKNGTLQGEGFSIVAIQCSLIEFFESTLEGVSYRCVRRKNELDQYEYNSSSQLFVKFLCNRFPFKKDFDQKSAQDYYESVRCGLLHEARTKNGWRIRAKGPEGIVVDVAKKIIYRDNFQEALLEFIAWYERALPGDNHLQEAFVRKFNSLCD